MNLRDTFSQNLKQLRKKRNLTQEQLAELVNVAPRHISFLETGKSFPSGDLIERICKALNINYFQLFTAKEEFSREELIHRIETIIENIDYEKLHYLYKMAEEL